MKQDYSHKVLETVLSVSHYHHYLQNGRNTGTFLISKAKWKDKVGWCCQKYEEQSRGKGKGGRWEYLIDSQQRRVCMPSRHMDPTQTESAVKQA